MSSFTRYQNCHRPEPVRGTVALWCKTFVSCSLMQREIQHVRFDGSYLDDVMVRQIALIAMSFDRARTQIPIDRRQQ